eukprot:sb/3466051/
MNGYDDDDGGVQGAAKKVVTSLPVSTELILNYGLDFTFGTACLLCFVCGGIGNTAAFFYFKMSRNNVAHTIYKVITLTDVVVSVCVVPVAWCYFSERSPGLLFGIPALCTIWGYTWNIVGRLSIFLVVVLSTTRTILVMKPFYSIKTSWVLLSIALYTLFLLVQLLLNDWLLDASVQYKRLYGECVFYTALKPRYPIIHFIGYTVPFIIPMFVVLVSCVCTVYAIALKPKSNDAHNVILQTSSSRVTKTILIFTAVYCIFNVPLVFDRLFVAVQNLFKGHKDLYEFKFREYYLNFTFSLSVAINSALNPWLYLWRMVNFRSFLRRCVRRAIPHRYNAVDHSCGGPNLAKRGTQETINL